jgi:hypothetical protein
VKDGKRSGEQRRTGLFEWDLNVELEKLNGVPAEPALEQQDNGVKACDPEFTH